MMSTVCLLSNTEVASWRWILGSWSTCGLNRGCWNRSRSSDTDLETLSRRWSTCPSILVWCWTSRCFLTLTKWILLCLGCFFVADTFFNVNATRDGEVSGLSRLGNWFFLFSAAWTTIWLTILDFGIVGKLISSLTSRHCRLLLVGLDLSSTLDNRSLDCDIARTVESQSRKGTQSAVRSLIQECLFSSLVGILTGFNWGF